MKKGKGLSIKVVAIVSATFVVTITTMLLISLFSLSSKFNKAEEAMNNFMSWEHTALDVKEASDYLTDQVRYYVYDKDKDYMDNYFYEAKVLRRRDNAINLIKKDLPDSEALSGVTQAVERSNKLMDTEYYAMRLVVDAQGIVMDDTYEDEVRYLELTAEDAALSSEAKLDLALEKVLGEAYVEDKEFIYDKISYAVAQIDTLRQTQVITANNELESILILQRVFIGINVAIVAVVAFIAFHSMISPLDRALGKIQKNEAIEVTGLREYRYLASVYNAARERSSKVKDQLVYQAEHDQLTGVLNRTGYDTVFRNADLLKCYYVLVDIDYFKEVNDKYGHKVGDEVLKKVALTLATVFNRGNEFVFRLGGDEFAVLIEENDNIPVEEVVSKCERVTEAINKEGKKIPEISLSMGIAKGSEKDNTDTLFKKADKALYTAKNNGRHNITVAK